MIIVWYTYHAIQNSPQHVKYKYGTNIHWLHTKVLQPSYFTFPVVVNMFFNDIYVVLAVSKSLGRTVARIRDMEVLAVVDIIYSTFQICSGALEKKSSHVERCWKSNTNRGRSFQHAYPFEAEIAMSNDGIMWQESVDRGWNEKDTYIIYIYIYIYMYLLAYIITTNQAYDMNPK